MQNINTQHYNVYQHCDCQYMYLVISAFRKLVFAVKQRDVHVKDQQTQIYFCTAHTIFYFHKNTCNHVHVVKQGNRPCKSLIFFFFVKMWNLKQFKAWVRNVNQNCGWPATCTVCLLLPVFLFYQANIFPNYETYLFAFTDCFDHVIILSKLSKSANWFSRSVLKAN